MATVDELIIEIRADLEDMKKNMQNAVKVVERSNKEINKRNEILAAGFNKVRFAAIAATGAITLMARNSLQEVDNIQKLSVRLGETTENLSRMKFVAEQNGIAFTTLTMAFQRMQRRVAEAAKGFGEAKDALKELGLNAEDLNQLTVAEQFEAVTRAMENVDNTADRTRLSMKLFDSEGVALAQIMDQGADAMRRLADETPNVITQEDAERIVVFNDNMNKLVNTIQGKLIPILSNAAGVVNKFFENIEPTLAAEKMKALAVQLKLVNGEIQALSNNQKSLFQRGKSFLLGTSTEEEISELKKRREAILKEMGSLKNDIKKEQPKNPIDPVEKEAVKSASVIRDTMIESTQAWSSSLTDAIVSGRNALQSLQGILARTIVQKTVVDPFIGAVTQSLTKPSASVSGSVGSNLTVNNYNTFNPSVQDTVRAEIATAAPLIQQASINGTVNAINSGKVRV